MNQPELRAVSWEEVGAFAKSLPPGRVYGVPRGGAILVGIAAQHGNVIPVATPEEADYIVDDIKDSGRTRARYGEKSFFAMVEKTPVDPRWVVFPWEHADPLADNEDTVVRQLQLMGEDPMREGLLKTPHRHLKALREMTSGYGLKAEDVLGTTFAGEGYDEIVVLRRIEFTSMCEHHILPFVGYAAIAYLPGERIVGLSKLARLVEMHARRLQVQERMTKSIADDIERVLEARGVAVVIEAHHSCMGCRGVRKPEARMKTSAMRGNFRHSVEARAEVMALIGA